MGKLWYCANFSFYYTGKEESHLILIRRLGKTYFRCIKFNSFFQCVEHKDPPEKINFQTENRKEIEKQISFCLKWPLSNVKRISREVFIFNTPKIPYGSSSCMVFVFHTPIKISLCSSIHLKYSLSSAKGSYLFVCVGKMLLLQIFKKGNNLKPIYVSNPQDVALLIQIEANSFPRPY